jgi:hypothetical protein
LREEQDEEFQRSLEADRQREADAAAEAERQAAAAEQAAREEAQARYGALPSIWACRGIRPAAQGQDISVSCSCVVQAASCPCHFGSVAYCTYQPTSNCRMLYHAGIRAAIKMSVTGVVMPCVPACRAQQEAAAAAAANAEASRQRRQQEAAARMAALPEPPAGSADTSLVRVRLPSGTNFQRR